MCGIAGILNPVREAGLPESDLRDLLMLSAQLAHRGPDGAGHWQNPGGQVSLAHRRLAIIDTSIAAAQPMHRANRFSITYNGELYNYIELREELKSFGHRFTTASDTEVILAAYEQYGETCLSHFDGMFAFAIWDELEQQLFLARDRFGEKPVFFHEDPQGRFLFASEMKAFWAIGIAKEPDEKQILNFLATGNTGFALHPEQRFYKQLYQLPPASCMTLKLSRHSYSPPVASRYWDIEVLENPANTGDEAVKFLSHQLERSVEKRLRADVAIGSSLSGGLDSSSIVAMIRRLAIKGFNGFSAVFPGFEKDESEKIELLSRRFGFQRFTTSPDADELVKDFNRLLWHQEEPIGSASVFVQFRVFELARKYGVKVLLDGQGADEVLAGYNQYIPWYLQEIWRKGHWMKQRKELAAFRSNGQTISWGFRNKAAALFPHLAQDSLIRKQGNLIRRQRFINQEFLSQFYPSELLFKPLVTKLSDLLYFDTTMGKLPELLRYADRNSMAHGVETRLPFLQHDLVQWLFTLPANDKLKDGYTKWILRKAMQADLPAEICWQKEKIAFEPPQLQWMQSAPVQENIRNAREKLVQKGILDKKLLSTPVRASSAYELDSMDWRYWVLASL